MLRQIALQDSVVYGPVQSRRLGSSLGINPLPVSYKLCSSNCVYCQYGWTLPARPPARLDAFGAGGGGRGAGGPTRPTQAITRAPELLAVIDAAFQKHAEQGTPVDCITLAGNGEPTLHPDLEELIVGLKRLRDRYFPSAKVGILSDATQLHRPDVARALQRLDVRYMKVDAGDEATWRAINLPLGDADWTRMIEGLKRLPDIILQSMFIQGSCDNTHEDHLDRWIALAGELRPLSVQVYTVDRAPADSGVVKVPRERLEAIASRLTAQTGIPAEVYE